MKKVLMFLLICTVLFAQGLTAQGVYLNVIVYPADSAGTSLNTQTIWVTGTGGLVYYCDGGQTWDEREVEENTEA